MINKYIDSALVLAFITAVLYCAYNRYLVGFYSELGINYEIIDKNIYQGLFSGLHVIFRPLFKFICTTFLYSFSLLILMVKLKTLGFFEYLKNKKLIYDIYCEISNYIKLDGNFDYLKKFTMSLLLLIAAMMITSYSLDSFSKYGLNGAIEMLKDIKMNKSKYNQINIKIDNNTMKLYIISCGDNKCAGYDDLNRKIYFFDKTNNFFSDIKNVKSFE